MALRRNLCISPEYIEMYRQFFDVTNNERDRCIFDLLYSGLRVSEVSTITVQNIDFKRGHIYLPYTKNDNPRTVIIEKSLMERLSMFYKYNKKEIDANTMAFADAVSYATGTLTEQIREELKTKKTQISETRFKAILHVYLMDYLRLHVKSPIFNISYHSIQNVIINLDRRVDRYKRHCPIFTALDTPAISPHSLRHTFSTNYLKNGGKPFLLQKQLGHVLITTTLDTYGHMDINDLETDFRKTMEGNSK